VPPTRNPEQLAKRLLKELDVKSPPVDLDRIADHLQITITNEDFEDELSGVLIKEDKETVIGVNENHPVTRRRFTIAHEIGHFLLAHPGQMFVDKTLRQKAVVVRRDGRSSEGTDAQEIEANRFAAELLMPTDIVLEEITKRLKKHPSQTSEDLASDMAELFGVSEKAMEYRLINLGCLLV
jgi:Zn-dependent peptidase ImmA (M78 family)